MSNTHKTSAVSIKYDKNLIIFLFYVQTSIDKSGIMQ